MYKTIREQVLQQAKTITEIRKANKLALKRAGTSHKQYTSGAAYALNVTEKFDK